VGRFFYFSNTKIAGYFAPNKTLLVKAAKIRFLIYPNISTTSLHANVIEKRCIYDTLASFPTKHSGKHIDRILATE